MMGHGTGFSSWVLGEQKPVGRMGLRTFWAEKHPVLGYGALGLHGTFDLRSA